MHVDRDSLRILMLITNLGQGGAERVFHDHATAFAASGMQVEQAVFAGEFEDAYRTPLPLHQLRTPAWLAWLGPPGRLLGRALALRRLVAVGGFDVVVSHMDGANWVNALSATSAGKVLVVHGSLVHDRNQQGWRQWLRTRVLIPFLYNKAVAAVAVSKGIRDELRQLGVRRAQAIPNFFDVQAIRQAASEKLHPPFDRVFAAGPVLVNSGRLSPPKNQAELLKLFAELTRRDPSVRLLILGDGEGRENLLALSETLGLRTSHPWQSRSTSIEDAQVVFAGYQSNPFALMARSALFVFPSLWEGFPLALCEAMACGVPVLSADCPTGPREILAPETEGVPMQATAAEFTGAGVLLPLLDSDAAHETWIGAVMHLLDAPARRQQLIKGGLAAVLRLDRSEILGRWQALLYHAAGEQG